MSTNEELQAQIKVLEAEQVKNAWFIEVTRGLNGAQSENELLRVLSLAIIETKVERISLFYFDRKDDPKDMEWMELAAIWTEKDTAFLQVGTRIYLSDSPFVSLWVNNPYEAICVPNVHTDERLDDYARNTITETGLRSVGVLPLMQGNQWLGVIILGWSIPHEFSEAEKTLYLSLIDPLTPAVESIRLRRETAHRANQLEIAAEVSRVANSILNVDELIKKIVTLAHNRFNLYYAGLFLVDRTGDWTGEADKWAVLRVGTGEAGEQMVANGHKLEVGGDSMIGGCLLSQKPYIAKDVGAGAIRFNNPLLPNTHTELALPLVSRDRAIGAMTIQSDRAMAFVDEDIAVFQAMVDQLAVAIENAEMFNNLEDMVAERAAALKASQQRLEKQNAALAQLAKSEAFNTGDLNSAIQEITQAAINTIDIARASVWLFDDENHAQMSCLAVYDKETGDYTAGLTRLRADFPAHFAALDAGDMVIAHIATANPATSELTESYLQPLGITAMICVPVRVSHYVAGMICCESKDERRRWSLDEESFCSSLADSFTRALEAQQRQQVELERAQLQEIIIDTQKQTLKELSTPIIPIMDNIIIIPLIGSIDTDRAQQITRSMLAGISKFRAKVVILDVTGVSTVDTMIADHLTKTIAAARLKGAKTIMTGVSNAVAETIVDLGIDWADMYTMRDLQTGLMAAIKQLGRKIAEEE